MVLTLSFFSIPDSLGMLWIRKSGSFVVARGLGFFIEVSLAMFLPSFIAFRLSNLQISSRQLFGGRLLLFDFK